MHCGRPRKKATTGGFACAGRLHGGGEPQLTQRREGRPLGDDELAVRVRDVALDVAAVDEVGEDALDLVDLHLGVGRLEASLEALDVELGRLVGVEQRDAAEEVAVHDQLGALDEQVRAVPDEALLVRRELLLERVEVASVHGAAERDEVVEPVLAQQRLGREHAEREPHGHEVAEHKPLVASRSARAALESPGELPLRGAKVGVEQRQPARKVPGQPAKEGRRRGGALAGPAGSKEVGRGERRRDCCCVAASRPVAPEVSRKCPGRKCLGSASKCLGRGGSALVRDDLRLCEVPPLDSLPVERLREGRALDRANQVLAEPQVVDCKVDVEEGVDHDERAPLL
mmetsp:Transcript_7423/g.24613  ORF Transcript_7423/g.24613 Transcript_7423/m.24613 type:complete len:343 (+) Transcript_7423:3-1031(+)